MNFATMQLDNNQKVFFELVRAGLWDKTPVHDSWFLVHGSERVDWDKVYQSAAEQSVQGLVLAGIEKAITNCTDNTNRPPQVQLLQWIGEVQIIEQQNRAMNDFVAKLIDKLREADVYAILVKGQGIAQCYERPLWRASGDVDLLLNDSNYEKAKTTLLPLALEVDTEYKSLKHLGMTMKEGFVVELHGMQHSRLSKRVDKGIDDAQHDVFCGGNVRSWDNKGTQVFLPSPDNDVIFIFTHILKHFYIEGIGLRQICDWCRLLWTYKDSLIHELLEKRIRNMGLMTEWKAFAAFAVEYLGMPVEAMPLFKESDNHKLHKKADRIMEFVMETGNFGHNREMKWSEYFIVGKMQAALFKMGDFARHARLFPKDSVKFYCHYLVDGIRQAYAKKTSK